MPGSFAATPVLFAALFASLASPAWCAEPAAADKDIYSLLSPTPAGLMRLLRADRPQSTLTPFTVDAGHFQIEMSAADYALDHWREGPQKLETWTFGSTAVKAGLLNNLDLQFLFDSYILETFRGPESSARTHRTGFGDIQVRAKVNLWGNDGGETALAVMPSIKIPTANDDLGNDKVEGGVIIPFAFETTSGWKFGFMGAGNAVYDGIDDNYDFEFLHAASIGHDVYGPLAWYGEYVGDISSERDQDYRAQLGTGLVLGVTSDIQFDAGVRAGLTENADDFGAFVGMTYRF
jgi:hypothetical protein